VKRSLVVTVIVGTLLNLINQGDVIWNGADVDWLKLVLTYCVPFFVATYGAYCVARETRGR
jgi:methyl-accepting chemotaxis protein